MLETSDRSNIRRLLNRINRTRRRSRWRLAAFAITMISFVTGNTHAGSYYQAIQISRLEPGLTKPLVTAVTTYGLKQSVKKAFLGFDEERTRARLTLLNRNGQTIKIYCNREQLRKWDCSQPPVYEKPSPG